MKKILFALLGIISINAFSQSMDFPGESIELLDGKELRVKPLSQSSQEYGYKGFYTDEKLKKNYKNKNYSTKYEALVGKVFKVVSYKPDYSDYVLVLSNPETGTLYYKYTPKFSHDYHFEVIGGLKFPDGFFCKHISYEKKFDYDRAVYYYIYHTPCKEDICLYKTEGFYKLHVLITASSDKKESGLKGVTLVLENGKEVKFPNVEVSVSASSSKYNYAAEIIGVTPEDLKLLQESPIIKKIVGNKEDSVEEGKLIMEYIKCIVKE